MKSIVGFFFRIIGLRRRGTKRGVMVIGSGFQAGFVERQSVSPLTGKPDPATGAECCVCLSSLRDGDETRQLPCCHLFHRVCVDKWLSLCKNTCPLCRFSLDGESNSQRREELTEEMVIWFSSFHVAGF